MVLKAEGFIDGVKKTITASEFIDMTEVTQLYYLIPSCSLTFRKVGGVQF
jgi:hypothetical protein